jgi:hypothetical protein
LLFRFLLTFLAVALKFDTMRNNFEVFPPGHSQRDLVKFRIGKIFNLPALEADQVMVRCHIGVKPRTDIRLNLGNFANFLERFECIIDRVERDERIFFPDFLI